MKEFKEFYDEMVINRYGSREIVSSATEQLNKFILRKDIEDCKVIGYLTKDNEYFKNITCILVEYNQRSKNN